MVHSVICSYQVEKRPTWMVVNYFYFVLKLQIKMQTWNFEI